LDGLFGRLVHVFRRNKHDDLQAHAAALIDRESHGGGRDAGLLLRIGHVENAVYVDIAEFSTLPPGSRLVLLHLRPGRFLPAAMYLCADQPMHFCCGVDPC
jgi:hypothetical protein